MSAAVNRKSEAEQLARMLDGMAVVVSVPLEDSAVDVLKRVHATVLLLPAAPAGTDDLDADFQCCLSNKFGSLI
jgi:hypothetical protein